MISDKETHRPKPKERNTKTMQSKNLKTRSKITQQQQPPLYVTRCENHYRLQKATVPSFHPK